MAPSQNKHALIPWSGSSDDLISTVLSLRSHDTIYAIVVFVRPTNHECLDEWQTTIADADTRSMQMKAIAEMQNNLVAVITGERTVATVTTKVRYVQ